MKQFLGAITITLCTSIALAQTTGGTGSSGQGAGTAGSSTTTPGTAPAAGGSTSSGGTISSDKSYGGYSLGGGNTPTARPLQAIQHPVARPQAAIEACRHIVARTIGVPGGILIAAVSFHTT